ncbi:hypothetical protein PR048_023137 [Dryococelus australis]|uniref:3-hydroxyisobutyryl-CoA hydrolase, mitochondrial n=1 Tax=Dryococelus australis TaxID=614101 RepID=A0ABQ9GT97_9NEOP|nr:hypothetical protein PR048_023137 [Dryococelus australis]
MMERIHKQLKFWRKEIRPVLVKSTGSKAFSVGGDQKYGYLRPLEISKWVSLLASLVATYPAPYVALMDGMMMGAGCGTSVHGQFRVATERTVLAMPEVFIGHFPDVCASYFLPRLPGKLCHLLGLTGHRFEGYQVMDAGLATHYCHSTSLPDLQRILVNCAGTSSLDFEAVLEEHTQFKGSCSGHMMSLNLEDVNACFSAAAVEDIRLDLERADDSWAREARARMAASLPTSLKLAK